MMLTQSSRSDGLEAQRDQVFDAARLEWPAIVLSREQFFEHLARLGFKSEWPRHVGTVYLCAACALHIPEACAALDRVYLERVRHLVLCAKRCSDFAEEVMQSVRERLLVGARPKIATYRGEGPFLAWLGQVVRRRSIDVLRAHREPCPRALPSVGHIMDSREASLPCCAEAPSPVWLDTMARALREAVCELDPADRELLAEFHLFGVRVETLCSRYSVDRATIYRRMRRCERWIGARTRAKLRLAGPSNIEAIIRTCYAEMHIASLFHAAAPRMATVHSPVLTQAVAAE